MASWHQVKAGIPPLQHLTKWRSYNPVGHLSVMTFESEQDCLTYCNKTGDVPLAPVSKSRGLVAPVLENDK